jgi:hypothetical protein
MGNVINNYYYTTKRTADNGRTVYLAEGGTAYVSGNYSANGWSINGGNHAAPFLVDAVTTNDAVTAAKQVVAQAGARGPRFGLDSVDQGFLNQISIK